VNTALIKRDLLENCKDAEYREAFVEENVWASVCAQIRALREQRDLSQRDLGRMAKGMAAERVCILENPNAENKPTLRILLRLANALGVGLDVRFVSFRTVLERSVDTDTKKLEVPSFTDELPILEEELDHSSALNFDSKLTAVLRSPKIPPREARQGETGASQTPRSAQEAAEGKKPDQCAMDNLVCIEDYLPGFRQSQQEWTQKTSGGLL